MDAIAQVTRSAKRLGIGVVLVGAVLVGGAAAGAAATNDPVQTGGDAGIAKACLAMHNSAAMQRMHAQAAGDHAAMHGAMSGMMTGSGMMGS